MKTPLRTGETIEKEGVANCQRGRESVGGRLFCTNARLIFESHAFNIQGGNTIINLVNIVEVRPVWTLFLGAIPLTPNSFQVQLSDGTAQSFVVWGRTYWMRMVEQLRVGAHEV